MKCICTKARKIAPAPLSWNSPTGPTVSKRFFKTKTDIQSGDSPELQDYEGQFRSIIDDGIHAVLSTNERAYWAGSKGRCRLPNDPARTALGIDGEAYYLDDGEAFKVSYGDKPEVHALDRHHFIAHGCSDSGWFGVSAEGLITNDEGVVLGDLGMAADPAEIEIFSGDEQAAIVKGTDLWFVENGQLKKISQNFPTNVRELFWEKGALWGWRKDTAGQSAVRFEQDQIVFQSASIPLSILFKVVTDRGVVYAISSIEGEAVHRISLSDGSAFTIEGSTTPFTRILDVVAIEIRHHVKILFAGTSGKEGRLVILDPESGATQSLAVPDIVPKDWDFAQWMIQENRIWLGIGVEEHTWLLEYRE